MALSLIWGVSISPEKATADYQLRLLLQYAFGQNNYGQIGLGFAEPSTTVIRAPMSSSAVWGAVASYPPGISKLPVDRWCEQKDCEAVVGRDALCTVCQGDWRLLSDSIRRDGAWCARAAVPDGARTTRGMMGDNSTTDRYNFTRAVVVRRKWMSCAYSANVVKGGSCRKRETRDASACSGALLESANLLAGSSPSAAAGTLSWLSGRTARRMGGE